MDIRGANYSVPILSKERENKRLYWQLKMKSSIINPVFMVLCPGTEPGVLIGGGQSKSVHAAVKNHSASAIRPYT
jgi:hypothetical protein